MARTASTNPLLTTWFHDINIIYAAQHGSKTGSESSFSGKSDKRQRDVFQMIPFCGLTLDVFGGREKFTPFTALLLIWLFVFGTSGGVRTIHTTGSFAIL